MILYVAMISVLFIKHVLNVGDPFELKLQGCGSTSQIPAEYAFNAGTKHFTITTPLLSYFSLQIRNMG